LTPRLIIEGSGLCVHSNTRPERFNASVKIRAAVIVMRATRTRTDRCDVVAPLVSLRRSPGHAVTRKKSEFVTAGKQIVL
jgi:hypothetical protein